MHIAYLYGVNRRMAIVVGCNDFSAMHLSKKDFIKKICKTVNSEKKIAVLKDFSSEFSFQASRSSGAGGQNVNKVNSRIELRFSVTDSAILSDDEKTILLSKIASKLTDEGILIITSQVSRSQLENKELCIEKFYKLIEKALTPQKSRRATKPTAASKRKRLDEKKGNSEKKQLRRKPL